MKLDEISRKKALLLLIVILIAMLIPIKIQIGETVEYKAVLYSVTNLHQNASQNYRLGTIEGTRIRILFFNIYDDSEFLPENIEHVLSSAE